MSATLLPRHTPGIAFRRMDLPGEPLIHVSDATPEGERRTVLRSGTASISTVEHFLAACWGMNVTALVVEVQGEELPIDDGSALAWVRAIGEAGLDPVSEVGHALEQDSVLFERAGQRLMLAPASRWSVHFAGVFPNGERCRVRWTAESDFAREFAPARTFCRLSEALVLRKKGLIRGGSPANSLVFVDQPSDQGLRDEVAHWWPGVGLAATHEGLLEPQRLRFPDEPARHKLVDLLGDLALLRPLGPCRVEAEGTGHRLAHELVRAVRGGRLR